jgi:hypothetical protein
MTAGNSWMMRPAGTGQTSFWPMPFHDFSQSQDLPQLDQLDQPQSSNWLLPQVQPSMPNYAMPYQSYPHYMYPEFTDAVFNSNEQNGTSIN